MRNRPSIRAAGAVALSLMAATPAIAQTADSSPSAAEQAIQDLKDRLALSEARNALFTSENDGIKARIDALGLPKTEGKTELTATGGKIETWMLSARTIQRAAKQIHASATTTNSRTLLLDSTAVLDLAAPFVLRRELQAFIASTDTVLTPCRSVSTRMAASALPAIIGAVLPLLRTDTTISGFTIDNAEGALINAIAGEGGGRYVLPSELVLPDDKGETLVRFEALLANREAMRPCAAQLAPKSAELAVLEAVATRIDAYVDSLVQRRDSKPGRLETAMLSDALSQGKWDVLRVRIEQAGGSIFKRSNLLTALGAPAIGLTGGLVVSWRLTTPTTGGVAKGGLLVCRTKLTNFNAIHRRAVSISDCDTNDTETKLEK